MEIIETGLTLKTGNAQYRMLVVSWIYVLYIVVLSTITVMPGINATHPLGSGIWADIIFPVRNVTGERSVAL
jgi:hypothetical protein